MKYLPSIVGFAAVALSWILGLPAQAAEIGTAAKVQTQPLDVQTLADWIDQQLAAPLAAKSVVPVGAASDSVLLRRASLDLTGRLPSPEVAARFLDDSRASKRSELIDQLVAGSAYAAHLADVWDGILFTVTSDNRRVALVPFNRWLQTAFEQNRPWNEIASELLTATGPQRENPAVTVFMGGVKTTLAPHEATDLVARAFLGVRLQCAQCHDHPFADWSHEDYWGTAAFFTQTSLSDKFPENATFVIIEGSDASQIGSRYGVVDIDHINDKHANPERGLDLPPTYLRGQRATYLPGESRRHAFAKWLTAAENPWFARAMVNRIWAQFFGRGLVMPIDDLRSDNPASHPELFDGLTAQFVAHEFDVKFLVRAICHTQAYQRSSMPSAGGNPQPDESIDIEEFDYRRMHVKVCSPEQLFDALLDLLGPEGVQRHGQVERARSEFIELFTTDEEPDLVSYRRGIPQALKLMNHTTYEKALVRRAAREAHGRSGEDVVERLYLLTLSRRPDHTEQQLAGAFLDRYEDEPNRGYAGLLWALINSSEFSLNR